MVAEGSKSCGKVDFRNTVGKVQGGKRTVDPDFGAEVLMLCWDGADHSYLTFSRDRTLGAATWPLRLIDEARLELA